MVVEFVGVGGVVGVHEGMDVNDEDVVEEEAVESTAMAVLVVVA